MRSRRQSGDGRLLLRVDQTNVHWPAPMSSEAPLRFRVSVVIAAVVLTGCNANRAVSLSSRTVAGVVGGPNYNPYNPISYAQNYTGNRSGGR